MPNALATQPAILSKALTRPCPEQLRTIRPTLRLLPPDARPHRRSAALRCFPHQSLEPADPYAKPAYSLDELKSFQQQENTAQLIFIAEQYLGRTLSPADMKSILFFTDKLHFSDDLIDYLLQYCVERGKKGFPLH